MKHIETLRQIARTQRRRAESAEARVAELEAEVKSLAPYRYLHPGVPEDLARCRHALLELKRHTPLSDEQIRIINHAFD